MNNGSGPKCPSTDRLRALIDWIGDRVEDVDEDKEWQILCKDAIDALDWLANMLDNRKLYHKKQTIKKKVMFQLAREYGLDAQANSLTRDALHDYVSSQKPDPDDIPININNDKEE